MTAVAERTTIAPDEIRAFRALLDRFQSFSQDTELVYTPHCGHSYYRDLFAEFGYGVSAGGHERLALHGTQMDQLYSERQTAAERALRAGGIEFRVEPNRTAADGGYFTPPAWLNQLFATAARPGRVLSSLMTSFDLPAGVGSVNLPVVDRGSTVQPQSDDSGVSSSDITDSAASSTTVFLSGFVDVALQLLELSPHTAAVDWIIFTDMSEATDAELELQLILGQGGSGQNAQLLGIANVPGISNVPYTSAEPTGSLLYPLIGQIVAQVGNSRHRPPQCLLMRTNRWAWIKTSEDTAGLPFDIGGMSYLGSTVDTPDPIGGLVGFPTFLDDAIPMNLTATAAGSTVSYASGGNEDLVAALRPTELMLFEGTPRSLIAREPLSAALGVRISTHMPVAALTARRPEGIAVLSGTGMAEPAGF